MSHNVKQVARNIRKKPTTEEHGQPKFLSETPFFVLNVPDLVLTLPLIPLLLIFIPVFPPILARGLVMFTPLEEIRSLGLYTLNILFFFPMISHPN